MRGKSSGSADELGLIGYGRFGRFAALHLSGSFNVFVADSSRRRIDPGLHRATLEEAASKPIVLLAVPIGRLREVLARIRSVVAPRALVLDVCSVKEQPVAWMKRYLPASVELMGTHPLFGPDSAAGGLGGHPIVLCPVRISKKRYRCVATFLRGHRLRVSTMEPADHDRLMASTLFLTQFIGRGILPLKLPQVDMAAQSTRLLFDLARRVGNDTAELFSDMYRFNRFARRIPGRVMREFAGVQMSLQRPKKSLPG